jgi:hypothetical protein
MTPVEAPLPPYYLDAGSVDPDLSPFLKWSRRFRWRRSWRRDQRGYLWQWDEDRGMYDCQTPGAKGEL